MAPQKHGHLNSAFEFESPEGAQVAKPTNSSSVSELTFRPCAVDLHFEDLAYEVKVKEDPKKAILSGLSGTFRRGQLTAIMGPSGAGKSSLLNVLAGFNRIARGHLVVNGDKMNVNATTKLMASISSYILQDDFLVAELTVYETLAFAARLKIPSDVDEKRVDKIIAKILKKIGLCDVSKRYVGNLSGGQRKRVAVAVELVNYPPVLFLDEPTTGLDSTSCYRLIELLKALANVGCNVICTIHQPNSRVFRMFDHLYVLAQGGRLAYDGAPLALTHSLKRIGLGCAPNENPADILFEKGIIPKLAEKWSDLADYAKYDLAEQEELAGNDLKTRLAHFDGDNAEPKMDTKVELKIEARKRRRLSKLASLASEDLQHFCTSQQATRFKQFSTLLSRAFLQARRDKVFFIGRFVAFTFATLVFGSTFQFVGRVAEKLMINIGYMYLITMLPLVGTSIVSILNFPVNFNVLLRENVNSWYSVGAFYWARAIVDNVLAILTGCIFPAIMWLLSSQLQPAYLALPLLALLMSIHSMNSHHFAYIIAMGGDEKSLPFLPFTVAMLHTLFSGFMIPVEILPKWISWMQFVNFGSFTYRALMRIAFGDITLDVLGPSNSTQGIKIPCGESAMHPLCGFTKGQQVMDFVEISDNVTPSIWIDMIVLLAYYIGFSLIGMLLLAKKVKNAKRAIART